ncbi:thioredoxin family protein [Halorussus gelatinilyticus]|uniref:Thioredoxin family protein n=1 Tax=Halorussus gelatinilyticus TaxID=2937524 RepID=A0A8U0IH80_9EURY|nr:thioredoxin family protein [Halorussus gelatinilyticus]UPW00333.1 thioredoxin family protein [Halorussus gelatinilyticus]
METTEPNPTWDAAAHSEVVDAFEAGVGEVTYRVWGADWCGDCRSALPDFFAALEAAGVADDQIEVYEVDRDKQGPKVDEYDVSLIPTVVVEHGDEEIARFEESEDRPAAEYVAERLLDADVMA